MELTKDIIGGTMEPDLALIVYKTKLGINEHYCELREIVDGQMLAGAPLTIDALDDLRKFLSKTKKKEDKFTGGIIPDNLIYADILKRRYVWYDKPKEQNFLFTSVNIPNGKIFMPGILYVLNDRSLSVYCFKGKKPKDILYKGPFLNTNDSGHVCLGGGGSSIRRKIKIDTYQDIINNGLNKFWNSYFSHGTGNTLVKNRSLPEIYKECIKNKIPFPIDQLVVSSVKLSDILK